MNPYIGSEFQLYGVEEYSLHGGYQEGVRMLHAKNGKGLEMVISLDRGGDIVYLTYKGKNVSYITPNGVSSHQVYDNKGEGWVKHFTAGFLTTCGYENVGIPCEENGVSYPMHGSINYTPVFSHSYEIKEDRIDIKLEVLAESLFSYKLRKVRIISISLKDNTFSVSDEVENRGGEATNVLMLFHFNIGYPLLKENSIVNISSDIITPRNEYSAKYVKDALKMQKPTPDFFEMVYFHHMKDKKGFASVYSPDDKFGVKISYDTTNLPCFTEWKMMGIRDYVLGLEPGNVTPDGYVNNKKDGRIVSLLPNKKLNFRVDIELFEE